MGQAYLLSGNENLAYQYFKRANSLYPGIASGGLSRIMRINRHELDSAMFYAQEAMRYQPGPWARTRCGEIWFDLGVLDSALLYFEKALQINPESPEQKQYVGRVLAVMGQSDKAITLLNQTIASIDSTDARIDNIHILIQYCYIFKGDMQSLEQFVINNKITNDFSTALILLGKGNVEAAQEIISIKKTEFEKAESKSDRLLGLAILATIENDLPTAAKLLVEGYDDFRLEYSDIIRIPYFLKLRGVREFDTLIARIKVENDKALKRMNEMNLN
jgi:tetratricopeptide (TPR) repeat protein